MATRKLTQSTIKQMVKSGAAIDATNFKQDRLTKLCKSKTFQLLGTSSGINGLNGCLFQVDGKMYAVTTRSSNLFTVC